MQEQDEALADMARRTEDADTKFFHIPNTKPFQLKINYCRL